MLFISDYSHIIIAILNVNCLAAWLPSCNHNYLSNNEIPEHHRLLNTRVTADTYLIRAQPT